MRKHSVVSALVLGLMLSVAGSAAAVPNKPKKDKRHSVPELGAESVSSAVFVVLAGGAVLAARRRRSAGAREASQS